MRRLFSKLGPAALIAAGFLIAGEAEAQRGCFAGNPLMTCPLAECIALDAAVHAPDSCSSQQFPLLGCNNPALVGCFNLQQARARWLRCYETRTILNMRCWNGGDPTHQAEAAIAITQVGYCDTKMREPPPIGCGNC